MPFMSLDYLDISRYSRPMAFGKSVADTLPLVAVLGAGNQIRVTLKSPYKNASAQCQTSNVLVAVLGLSSAQLGLVPQWQCWCPLRCHVPPPTQDHSPGSRSSNRIQQRFVGVFKFLPLQAHCLVLISGICVQHHFSNDIYAYRMSSQKKQPTE